MEPAKPHILIVEDNALIAISLALAVEAMGYTVAASAASGARALEMARKAAPGIALVDLNLQDGRTGLTVARTLARDHGTANPEDIAPEAEGVACVVRKPFTDDALAAAIAHAKAARKTQKPARVREPIRAPH